MLLPREFIAYLSRELVKKLTPASIETNNPQAAATFYQSFYLSLMQDIFVVLTDREHKTGFKLQAMILQHMFEIVDENKVSFFFFCPQSRADKLSIVL